MSADRVAVLLADLSLLDVKRYALVLALRKSILDMHGEVTEEVKYGGILFGVQKHFCGIFSYSRHVSLEFGEGAKLPDPHMVLEGAGKFRRHIKLFSEQDITDKHVHDYLLLALAQV